MKIKIYFSLFIISTLITSCEKNTYFQSEKKVAQKIQKTWVLYSVSESQAPEEWSFSNGKVYRISTANGMRDTIDIGNYEVYTTLSDAFVSISSFKMATSHLNTTFTITDIDEEILVLFGNDEINGGGTIYRDFTAK